MSFSDRESGIVAAHIPRLEQACKDLNLFLFIRPTEYASTKLIQQGYATKNMSVHDKSSDWGPMAGFVPVDQFFSKKYIGSPNKNPNYSDHGPALVCHLQLTDALVNDLEKLNLEKTGDKQVFTVKSPNTVAKGIRFQLQKSAKGWDVYWLNGDSPVKLYVWGYKTGDGVKPVTGDYDLWMVAPHMSWWKLHMQIVGVKDDHGSSCATLLNTWLLGKLNEACNRSDNPVFNHGAEAQNYGFTQSLDRRIAMVTPAGTSRMIDSGDMPQVLADLQSAAYLVYWNKRYGETDPQLSGQAFSLDGIQATELNKLLNRVGSGNDGVIAHLAKKNEKLRDIVDIKKFHAELKRVMLNMDNRQDLKFLAAGDKADLPSDYREKIGTNTLKAQKSLQRAVVEFGGGGDDIERMEKWTDAHIEDIFALCEGYGEASGATGSSGSFMLERIPGTTAYRRKAATSNA